MKKKEYQKPIQTVIPIKCVYYKKIVILNKVEAMLPVMTILRTNHNTMVTPTRNQFYQ